MPPSSSIILHAYNNSSYLVALILLVGCVAMVTSSIIKSLPLPMPKVVLVLDPGFEEKSSIFCKLFQ